MSFGPQIPIDQSQLQRLKNGSHLSTLTIMHYLWGGIVCVISSCFIGHVVIGVLTITGKIPASAPTSESNAGFPPEVGWLFLIKGSVAVILGWTTGILNLISAKHFDASTDFVSLL